MNYNDLLWVAGIVFVLFSAFALWLLRREYRHNGKLSWFGSTIHVAVYAVHGMFCSLLLWGPEGVPPMGALAWLSIPLMVIGLGIVFYAMDLFRTFSRWLGSGIPGLATNGLYRYSRNPQFVGYGLFLLGFFVAWWNSLAWIGLLAYAVTIVEEEHLIRTYGDSYRDYCRRVPRYIGFLPKH